MKRLISAHVLWAIVAAAMLLLSGCSGQPEKAAVSVKSAPAPAPMPAPPSMRMDDGVDVLDVDLKRNRQYVKPATNDEQGVFSALTANKYELQAAAEDQERMRLMMLLSDRTGKQIVIHKARDLEDKP